MLLNSTPCPRCCKSGRVFNIFICGEVGSEFHDCLDGSTVAVRGFQGEEFFHYFLGSQVPRAVRRFFRGKGFQHLVELSLRLSFLPSGKVIVRDFEAKPDASFLGFHFTTWIWVIKPQVAVCGENVDHPVVEFSAGYLGYSAD